MHIHARRRPELYREDYVEPSLFHRWYRSLVARAAENDASVGDWTLSDWRVDRMELYLTTDDQLFTIYESDNSQPGNVK